MKESFFRFTQPQLTQFMYQENPGFDEENFGAMPINCQTSVSETNHENEAFVSVNLSIGDDITSPFSIAVEMGAVFSWAEHEEDEKLIDTLLHQNAPSLLIGYIRPLVSMITSASSYPTLNIPFLDLTKEEEN